MIRIRGLVNRAQYFALFRVRLIKSDDTPRHCFFSFSKWTRSGPIVSKKRKLGPRLPTVCPSNATLQRALTATHIIIEVDCRPGRGNEHRYCFVLQSCCKHDLFLEAAEIQFRRSRKATIEKAGQWIRRLFFVRSSEHCRQSWKITWPNRNVPHSKLAPSDCKF
jgi:hypothetical protein